jgi:hypothetical protein
MSRLRANAENKPLDLSARKLLIYKGDGDGLSTQKEAPTDKKKPQQRIVEV